MKKLLVLMLLLSILLCYGCGYSAQAYDVVATTLPIYEFTVILCEDTNLSVGRLITENVSCLHDYTLQVNQMRMIESADVVLISGLGLEDFLEDTLLGASSVIDASTGVHTHNGTHEHEDDLLSFHAHNHETDPHIWLSPKNAQIIAANLAEGLSETYPEYRSTFSKNLAILQQKLSQLQEYGETQLGNLGCYELITFHDGFSYFAESFNLTILEAVEEESGSEASAAEIIHLVELVETNALPAIFIERNGSNACASIIHAETGSQIYTLDMAMAGDSYFDAMYHNIDSVKEALG